MKKILLLFGLIAFSLPSYSSDWQLVSTNSFLVDKSSVEKKENTVRAWTMRDFKGITKGKKHVYVKVYEEVDCKNKTLADLFVIYYDKNDNLVDSIDAESLGLEKHTRVVPDSNGELIFNELCSYK